MQAKKFSRQIECRWLKFYQRKLNSENKKASYIGKRFLDSAICCFGKPEFIFCKKKKQGKFEIRLMTSKKIGHLFYTTLSIVHHFKAISEVKLELKSENARFGSKSAIICAVWTWNLKDDPAKQ